jgi:hypothetical protein
MTTTPSAGIRIVADAAVRTFLVVVASVILDEDAGLGHAEHEFAVEAFVAQASVEAFDVAVLPGTAGSI